MIYDTSYPDREIIAEINRQVGKPFSLKNRIQLKGIGSARMVMAQVSEDIFEKLPFDNGTQNASIELRPQGIIVHFKRNTEHFSWAIPYYKLTIYQSEYFSLYEHNTFMKFKLSLMDNSRKKFIKKLVNLRAQYLASTQPF